MRSATSYFRPSWALLRENLKRFWAVPAVGMVCWFFAGIFPLLIDGNSRQWFIMAADMRHPAFIIFTPIFPLIASAVTLRYLFSPSSVSAMHTLPLTRGRLYCTSFVSAAAMSIAPAVVTYLVMALPGAVEGYSMLPAFALTLLLTLFYTALFHVAAMLTGSGVMHLGVCGFLSFAPSALVLLVGVYCQSLLFGYSGDAAMGVLATRLVPLLYFTDEGILSSAVWLAAYILSVPALYATGAVLYARRHLERAGDSIVFPFFELIFTFTVTFAGMTVLSMIFDGAGWGKFPFNLGLLFGAALCLIASRMVAKKSLRVFNGTTLLRGGVFAGAAALLICFLNFDLTGYEKRVPAPERVEYAELNRDFLPWLSNRQIYAYGNPSYLVFSEPENIRAVTGLHSSITELRDLYDHSGLGGMPRGTGGGLSVYLRYQMTFGELSRRYFIPAEHMADDANARALFESEEFKLQNDVSNAALGQPISVVLSPRANYGRYDYFPNDSASSLALDITISSDEYAELLNALAEDMRGETWEDITSNPLCDFVVSIDYIPDTDTDNAYARASRAPAREWVSDPSSNYAEIAVPPHYERTITWLVSRGYYERLTAWREQIVSAQLTRVTVENGADGAVWHSSDSGPVITDAASIRRALDGASGQPGPQWRDGYWDMTISIGDSEDPYSYVSVFFPADSPVIDNLIGG
ncbi:MAG: hypothetical protein LBS51_00765 [Oscillospiraceae bacterium]|jgi:ABC-2 type transport system permease protein|nr:hypothetical protein [Oscillospiraceae bacterium]